MMYIERDGLKGYVDEAGAWITMPTVIPNKKEFITVSLSTWLSSISYEDQDKLGAYFQAKPIIKEFLSIQQLTEANIYAMKARVDADFANATIDEDSKIKLQGKLDELLTKF